MIWTPYPGGTYLSKHPQPVKLSKKEEMELIQNLWNPEDQMLYWLKEDIVAGTTLVRSYQIHIFNIKTYWSNGA